LENSGAGFQPAETGILPANIKSFLGQDAPDGRQDACPTGFSKHALTLNPHLDYDWD